MNNRGFLFTVLTFLLAFSIMVLAGFFAMERNPADVSAEKVRNVFDDIGTDFGDMLELSVSVERSGGYVTVFFDDHMPLTDGVDLVSGYESFIRGGYSTETNSNISLVGVGDSEFTVEPFGLTYGYPDYGKGEVWVYSKSGDASGVVGYVVTLNFDKNLRSVTPSSVSGGLDVELNAVFANEEYGGIFSVSRDGNSTWFFDFGDSNLTLAVGRNMIGGLGRDSSVLAGAAGVEGDVVVGVVFADVNETVGVRSGVCVGVEDGMTRQDYVWLVRG